MSAGPSPRQAPNRKAEHSAETQRRLIDAARTLFAERGYAATGTEDLVAAARMTRGALYHHYADKRDLFRAVFEHVEEEIGTRVATAAAAAADPWEQMRAGIRAILSVCREPGVRRIVLIDGPSVLGWEEWRRIDTRYSFGMVRAVIEANVAAGNLEPLALGPFTHLVVGGLNEAALAVAAADDPDAAIEEFATVLEKLMDAQRRLVRAGAAQSARAPRSRPAGGGREDRPSTRKE